MRSAGGPGGAAAMILAEAGFPAVDGLETAAWQGTPALTRRTHPLGDARVLVVGDAAGYAEPFTGEGIAWALAAGRAVAPLARQAGERWDPRLVHDWGRLHRRVVRRRQAICRAAAAVLRRPWLVRAAFEVAARLPDSAVWVVRRLNAPPHFVEAS
jgi:menaquinone-9 beta-reductase